MKPYEGNHLDDLLESALILSAGLFMCLTLVMDFGMGGKAGQAEAQRADQLAASAWGTALPATSVAAGPRSGKA